ncbi:MAG: metal ABC transporter permease [Myxococcales bacterium]|nr:metal ABC transporter permease [Myxococcales bacterium]
MPESPTLSQFFDAWELFRVPTLAGTVAGAVLGFLGVYIVLRRMVFLTAALSQCAGLGVVIAFYLRTKAPYLANVITPTAGALLSTVAAALIPMFDPTPIGNRRDALLGALFLVGAAGTLALGTRIVEEIHDVESLLFGSAVVVLEKDLTALVFTGSLVFLIHLIFLRGFSQTSFDATDARVRGLPVKFIQLALLLTLALSISITTRILGALPVFAFSVMPAVAALRTASNIRRAMLLASVIGGASGFCGYVAAFLYNLPVGASQVLSTMAFLALTIGVEWVGPIVTGYLQPKRPI